MLQTRNGKRTGSAALRVAIDMAKEGLVSQREAVLMVEPRHLDQVRRRGQGRNAAAQSDLGTQRQCCPPTNLPLSLQVLHPMFADAEGEAYKGAVVGRGLPASPGAACGRVVFDAETAEAWRAKGEQVRGLRCALLGTASLLPPLPPRWDGFQGF